MERSLPLAGLAAFALSLVVASQDESERDARDVLDALLERTNTIESYRAVYETLEGERHASLTVAHVWPDKAYVRFAGDAKHFTASLVEGLMFGESDDGPSLVDFRPGLAAIERIQESLSDVFPGALPPEGTPGAKISLFVVQHERGRGSGGNFSLTWVTDLRARLPWLADMKRHAEYELDQDLIHCRPNDSQDVWIDLESGFPRRMEIRDDEGTRILELVELELEPELPDALFDPAPFEGSELPDEELRRLTVSFVAPQKNLVYRRLCDHFDSHPESWDEDDVRSVFDALHEVMIEIQYTPWLEETGERIVEFGERLSQASAVRPSDEIDAGIERFRNQLEEVVYGLVRRDLERLARAGPQLGEGTPSEYLEDMFALEREAAEAVYQRLLGDALLEQLAQVVEENRQD